MDELEQRELERLLSQSDHQDIEQFERTAAALVLASFSEQESLPIPLRAQLLAQVQSEVTKPRTNLPPLSRLEPAARNPVSSRGLAWLAAAASLVAIIGWWPKQKVGLELVSFVSQASPDQQTIIERRQALLTDPSTVQRAWQKTQDPGSSAVTGDVVWNARQRMGYLRLRGLPINNPRQEQYQLWIFDSARGDQYPVDGGVFNMPAYAKEIVIPIVAKLTVHQATMFAVTIEHPGGVVVSSRERVVVITTT